MRKLDFVKVGGAKVDFFLKRNIGDLGWILSGNVDQHPTMFWAARKIEPRKETTSPRHCCTACDAMRQIVVLIVVYHCY